MDRPRIREAATQPIAASSGVVTDSTKPSTDALWDIVRAGMRWPPEQATVDAFNELRSGQRSRDAEVERLTRELAEAKLGLAQYEGIPMLAALNQDALVRQLAESAHDAIMKDLLGRCGIENAFDDIDSDIRAEIDATCIAKATAAITAALARGGK